jgi:hypothetical protein
LSFTYWRVEFEVEVADVDEECLQRKFSVVEEEFLFAWETSRINKRLRPHMAKTARASATPRKRTKNAVSPKAKEEAEQADYIRFGYEVRFDELDSYVDWQPRVSYNL